MLKLECRKMLRIGGTLTKRCMVGIEAENFWNLIFLDRRKWLFQAQVPVLQQPIFNFKYSVWISKHFHFKYCIIVEARDILSPQYISLEPLIPPASYAPAPKHYSIAADSRHSYMYTQLWLTPPCQASSVCVHSCVVCQSLNAKSAALLGNVVVSESTVRLHYKHAWDVISNAAPRNVCILVCQIISAHHCNSCITVYNTIYYINMSVSYIEFSATKKIVFKRT